MPEVDGTAAIVPLQAKYPPPIRTAVKANKEAQAKEEVSAIESQSLAIGWERDQLDELSGIMKIFMPCKIGTVRLAAIEILMLNADGTIRGANRFYNMRTEQPWLKKLDRPPTD